MFDETDEVFTTISSSFYYADGLHCREVDLPNIKSCLHRFFDPIRQGSLRGAISLYIGLSINSSCFAFPYILYKLGFIPSILLFLFCGISTQFIIEALINISRKTKVNSYQKLLQREIGTKTTWIFNIINITTLLIIILSFLKFIDVLLYDIIKGNMTKYIIIKVISCFIIQFPLSLIKTQSSVQIISLVGFVLMIYVIGVILYLMIMQLIAINNHTDDTDQVIDSKVQFTLLPYTYTQWYHYFMAFSLINAGFFTQNGVLAIVNGLKGLLTKRRGNKIVFISFTIQMVFYIIIAIGGYYYNTSVYSITSLLLSNNSNGGDYNQIVLSAQICLILSILLILPIRWNLVYKSLNTIIEKKESLKTLYMWIIGIVLIALNICSHYVKFMPLIAIYGGLFSAVITFLFPTIIYSTIFGYNSWTAFAFWGLTLVFLFMGFCGLLMGILDMFNIIQFVDLI